jgi:hypothetical protein
MASRGRIDEITLRLGRIRQLMRDLERACAQLLARHAALARLRNERDSANRLWESGDDKQCVRM